MLFNSSILKTWFHAEILYEGRQIWQRSCGSCLVYTVLSTTWGVALSCWNPMTTDHRKMKAITYNLCTVPTEILSYSEMSSIITLMSIKMSALTWSTISGELAIVDLPTSFKKFSSFVNIVLTKTCYSVYITHSSVNFTWVAHLDQQIFDDRPLLFQIILQFNTLVM